MPGQRPNGVAIAIETNLDEKSSFKEDEPFSDSLSDTVQVCRWKTVVSWGFMFFAILCNDIALSFVHERIPERSVEPLPDIWFYWFPEYPMGMFIAEYLISGSMLVAMLLAICCEHRWIILRRSFFVAGMVYLIRALAISVTLLPMPSKETYCIPKADVSVRDSVSLRRIGTTIVNLGMDSRGQALCGDLIISGHTITLMMPFLIAKHFSPRRLQRVLMLVTGLSALCGVCGVLTARKHYTIDVILSYYLTTRTFWAYQTMVNDAHSALHEVWWSPIHRFLESDAPPVIVNRFQLPFQCASTRNRWNNRRLK